MPDDRRRDGRPRRRVIVAGQRARLHRPVQPGADTAAAAATGGPEAPVAPERVPRPPAPPPVPTAPSRRPPGPVASPEPPREGARPAEPPAVRRAPGRPEAVEPVPERPPASPAQPPPRALEPDAGEAAAAPTAAAGAGRRPGVALADWPRAAVVVAAAMVLAFFVLGGLAGFRWVSSGGIPANVTSVPPAGVNVAAAAQAAAHDLFTVDYRNLAAGLAAADARLAPSFRGQYDKVRRGLASSYLANQAFITAQAEAVGVRDLRPDSAVALVFVDQVSTNAKRAVPRVDENRVVMTMVKIGGQWLVAGISAI